MALTIKQDLYSASVDAAKEIMEEPPESTVTLIYQQMLEAYQRGADYASGTTEA